MKHVKDKEKYSESLVDVHLPNNNEAEQSVLGAIILDKSCLNMVIEILPKSDFFYFPENKKIYEAILEMFLSGEKIDFVTVLDKISIGLDDNRKFELKNYMLDLVQMVPSISGSSEYAQIVKNKHQIRSIINASEDVIKESKTNDEPEKLLGFAEQKLFDIRFQEDSKGLVSIKDTALETYERLDRLNSRSQTETLGIPTGFNELDESISGLNGSDLILLAARPGMGKTSFALSIARNVSLKHRTAIFSLEMSREQLTSRFISIEGNIPGNKLRGGRLDFSEWKKFASVSYSFSKFSLYIDDTAGITIPEMKSKIRHLGEVKLVVIDYLQLITSTRRIESRVQEISEITRQLKIMAKELNIPIICLSQLSRASEQRQDHRPMLSDLRDSGSIEQDADIVLMLYRPGYYSNPLDEKIDPTECECIIAKNRYGETRTVMFNWQSEYTKFTQS